MEKLLEHRPAEEIGSYQELKKSILKAGLLSCSEQGFNILRGPLAELAWALATHLGDLCEGTERWTTPLLLRRDWVIADAWHDPPPEQWCTEQPGGHLLAPRPLMHLLNRLRRHPQQSGAWLLSGPCVRNEQGTLPLYRQRAFTILEYAWLGEPHTVGHCQADVWDCVWELARGWDLPVDQVAGDDTLRASAADYAAEWSLRLLLPDLDAVPLARATVLPLELCAAYGLAPQVVTTLGLGVERWCLAILARYGVEPAKWPIQPHAAQSAPATP
jgi:hypothetical protein